METDGTVETDKRTEKHVTDDVWVTSISMVPGLAKLYSIELRYNSIFTN